MLYVGRPGAGFVALRGTGGTDETLDPPRERPGSGAGRIAGTRPSNQNRDRLPQPRSGPRRADLPQSAHRAGRRPLEG